MPTQTSKSFRNQGRQGDVLFTRVEKLPKGLKQAVPNDRGEYIVAHSETGHNHTVMDRPNVKVYETDNPLIAFLEVYGDGTDTTEMLIEHHRDHHTHETLSPTLLKGPNYFRINRQAEQRPEGWKRVID